MKKPLVLYLFFYYVITAQALTANGFNPSGNSLLPETDDFTKVDKPSIPILCDDGIECINNNQSISSTGKILVLNPYKDIDWKTTQVFKTNLHTHSTNSDGVFHPHQVVDLYHSAGYNILSITDHNAITYPWTAFSGINAIYEDRNPETLGMLAVAGNELSASHHTGSYLNVVPGNGANLVEAFNTMAQIDGLGAFKHPGRYWDIMKEYLPGEQYSIEWYQNYYEVYPVLVGMELFNMGDRYPNDRVLWDELLTRMMPDRPIWGHSNDDMHDLYMIFRNYSYFLMPELSHASFSVSMRNGSSFFVNEPKGNGSSKAPMIDSITVNKLTREITIHASNFNSIEWISGVEGIGPGRTSKVIATGSIFDYYNTQISYVRAVVSNDNGKIFTQPFGFDHRKPKPIGNISVLRSGCYDDIIFSVEDDYSTDSFTWVLTPDVGFTLENSENSIKISPTRFTGIMNIKVFKTNIFGHSDTASIKISVNQPLPTPFISENAGVLYSDAAEGNQWYDQYGPVQGAKGQTFTPEREGEYYVIVTQFECSSEISNIITLDYDGLWRPRKNDLIRIYPNPFKKLITLESGYKDEKIEFEIINSAGQRILKDSFIDLISITTDHLPMGLYIIKFESVNHSISRKIVKK